MAILKPSVQQIHSESWYVAKLVHTSLPAFWDEVYG